MIEILDLVNTAYMTNKFCLLGNDDLIIEEQLDAYVGYLKDHEDVEKACGSIIKMIKRVLGRTP